MSGFSGYDIEDYDFFGDGINSLTINSPPDDNCTNQFVRGSVIND